MAYSCVKVLFEIGHEASIRAKCTPEGFTHDWEVFVRGADNSDIFHFVEKVVFHLHETFQKPKRVVKEPPYSVKESGYAGFIIPIEIYFKNSDEPKKFCFNYDLNLHTVGPPVSKVLRQKFVFPNPAEDLRRRLIKGGGVGVLGSESGFHPPPPEKNALHASDEVSHKHSGQTLVGKPKLSGNDPGKKLKIKEGKSDEIRVSNSFRDLFGPPIKKSKVSPDPKKSSHSSPKVSPVSKSSKPIEKLSSDKPEKSSKSSKHGSQKEGKESSERSSSSTKEEKKDKEKSRDKEKTKDKLPKRPSSPVKPPSTSPKHPSSPPKRPSTPPKRSSPPAKHLAPPLTTKLSSSPKSMSSSKSSKDESKKNNSDESKNKNESKSSESGKSEKKKKDKKNRDEKPKKDKHKDHEKSGEKSIKSEKSKDSKDKDSIKKLEKEVCKEPEKSREKEKEKTKHSDGDKEKQKHKHKKKDKSNKDKDREKGREKDKSMKKSSESKVAAVTDKDKNGLVNDSFRGSTKLSNDISSLKKEAASTPSPSPVQVTNSPRKPSPTPEKSVSSVPSRDKIKRPPISDDSSESHSSGLSADEDVEPPVNRIKSVKTPENSNVSAENKIGALPVTETPRPNSRNEVVKIKSENIIEERNSLNKNNSKQKEKISKKHREREACNADGEKLEKESKKNKRKRSNRIIEDRDCTRSNGETPMKVPKLEVENEEPPVDLESLEGKVADAEVEIKEESEPEDPAPPATHLTEEYVSQLRELQHKIMTLEDNAELQRVVQVIAETGQYEITKKTFDFDLCALDRNTVARLQEFFAS